MARTPGVDLSRRERQIMDVIYRLGRATAAQVVELLPDPPKDVTVRKLIRVLEEKGHLAHERRGREYVYRPTLPRSRARRAALKHLVDTFFDGSLSKAFAALLNVSRDSLTGEELDELAELIETTAREGR